MLLDLLGGLGFCFLLVQAHDHGHLWSGCALVVPADAIRVRLRNRPPHVAQRGGEAVEALASFAALAVLVLLGAVPVAVVLVGAALVRFVAAWAISPAATVLGCPCWPSSSS